MAPKRRIELGLGDERVGGRLRMPKPVLLSKPGANGWPPIPRGRIAKMTVKSTAPATGTVHASPGKFTEHKTMIWIITWTWIESEWCPWSVDKGGYRRIREQGQPIPKHMNQAEHSLPKTGLPTCSGKSSRCLPSWAWQCQTLDKPAAPSSPICKCLEAECKHITHVMSCHDYITKSSTALCEVTVTVTVKWQDSSLKH